MNPAFIIVVILICVAAWFLASALYKPIGKFFYRIGKDAADELNKKDDEVEEKGK